MTLSREFRLSLFRKMLQVRRFEQKAIEMYQRSVIHGTIHSCVGQEASTVGVIAALEAKDYVTSTHRGHGHSLAKGSRIPAMFAELFGRETGCCRGRGGSMHIADVAVGMLGCNAIVAGSTPHAVGAALSGKLQGSNNVVACFIGDAAVNQGAFHESANLAAVWQLPVLFTVENNQYGVSTRIQDTTALKQLSDRAAGYGMPGVTVDGQDVEAVYAAALALTERGRRGEGPALLETITYRYEGHNYGQPMTYRSKEEIDSWRQKDPVFLYREKLAGMGYEADLKAIEAEVEQEMAAAIAWALEQPLPDVAEITDLVYVDNTPFPDLSGRRRVYEE
ncbi:MAG: dehydrogenase component [Firmicutes bacterium]|nr:dehydrogenase component [Bacillota bacterium]